MKHVGSFLHESDVPRCGICTLAVLDGVDEAVPELARRAQKIVFNEIGHAVIWEKGNTPVSNITINMTNNTMKYGGNWLGQSPSLTGRF